MSRRVRKRIFVYNEGWPALTSTPDTDLKFVYDEWTLDTPVNPDGSGFGRGPAGFARPSSQGWNVVLMLTKTPVALPTTRKYTWGLDMSGLAGQNPDREAGASGLHSAGGVSGLLAVEETAATGTPKYWFFYDGNGNIGQAIKVSDLSTAAHYEYDPYGNIIASSGSYADTNPFRFSTKWFDTESALDYWGYRYYSPRLGRWLNRDPIEEEGGLNQYAFLLNDPISMIDPHGNIAIVVPVVVAVGGLSVAEAAAEAFGLTLMACMLVPDCRAAVNAALAEAAKSIAKTICPPVPNNKKDRQWECTIKAREWPVGTPCYGKIFAGYAETQRAAAQGARHLCYSFGCQKPGKGGGNCGHLHCYKLP